MIKEKDNLHTKIVYIQRDEKLDYAKVQKPNNYPVFFQELIFHCSGLKKMNHIAGIIKMILLWE